MAGRPNTLDDIRFITEWSVIVEVIAVGLAVALVGAWMYLWSRVGRWAFGKGTATVVVSVLASLFVGSLIFGTIPLWVGYSRAKRAHLATVAMPATAPATAPAA